MALNPDDVRKKKEIIYTKNGVQTPMDMPELQAQGLHAFPKWMCSIGQNVLFINGDGNVSYGTCHPGGAGVVGDIYTRTNWVKPPTWFSCHRDWCHCGAEIKQTKISPDASTVVRPELVQNHVIWDICRYCNFDCSYCPSTVHNHHEVHKPLAILKRTVDLAEAYFDHQPGTQFALSGGEPTIDPSIVPLCQYIQSKGHQVHIQSNGSRGKKLWEALAPHVDSITVSIHFEFLTEARLLRNIGYILDNLSEGAVLEVKMISQAENMEYVRELRDKLLGDPKFAEGARLAIMPVSDYNLEEKTRKPRTYGNSQLVEFGYH